MNLADVLHALVEKVYGWGARPDLHDVIDQHAGAASASAESEPSEAPQTEA